jgi:glycine/D-amino acid oxidase-like deaminating enzyme
MQKVINVLAVLSFVGTAGIVGGGTALYLNKDSIVDNIKSQVAGAAAEAIAGQLPGMMDSAMPELPDATGGAIPVMPSATGGAIPSLPF